MGEKVPMISNTVFGGLGLLIFTAASYYSYKILDNFDSDSHVASSMFFLEDRASRTFRTVSLLVLSVVLGEGLILASNYVEFAAAATALGKTSLIVSMLSALYFVRSVAEITEGPSDE